MSDAGEIDLGRETAGATVAQVVMALGGFIGTIVFARVLGPASFGGVYLLFALTKIADRPMSGWATATKKRVSEHSGQIGQALGAQLVFNGLCLVLLGGVALFAGNILQRYTGLPNASILFVILLATASGYETLERLVQARGRISVATWIDTVRSYLTLPLQLALVLTGLGAAGMIYGLAIASLLSLSISAYVINTHPKFPSRNLIKSYWAYARYSIPTAAFGTIYDRLDVLLLGLILTPATAGYYEVAWKLTLPAMFLSQAASQGLMAKVSALNTQQQDVTTDIHNTISFSSLFALPLFVGAIVLRDDLIRTIYGPEYVAATSLLLGLTVFRIVRTQSGPLLNAVNGLNRPDVSMRLSGAAVLVNLTLGASLTVIVGPIGVVIATIVAELIRYVGAVHLLRRELVAFTPLTRGFIEQAGAALIMGVVVAGGNHILEITSWMELSVLLGLGGLTYTVFLIAVSSQFRLTVRSVVSGS